MQKVVKVFSCMVLLGILIVAVLAIFACKLLVESVDGTYFYCRNGNADKSQYIILQDGTWSNELGENGEYKIENENITFYSGKEENKSINKIGTLKDGMLSVDEGNFDTIYFKDGSQPKSDSMKTTEYSDKFVSFKPASEGWKSETVQQIYEEYVDKAVYVEITSDDIGGMDCIGAINNFTLRTVEGMEYNVKKNYTWSWYQGSFNNPNGAQRFTLNYGSNIQLVTISDDSGVVLQTYLVDIYVRQDYTVSLYESNFSTEPFTTVRVIENESFSTYNPVFKTAFEFDTWLYQDSETKEFEKIHNKKIQEDMDLYQTYKPCVLQVELDGGTCEEVKVQPYTKNVTFPIPEKDGYHFIGWAQWSYPIIPTQQSLMQNIFANSNGNTGSRYLDENNLDYKYIAVYSPKYFHLTRETFKNEDGSVCEKSWILEDTQIKVYGYSNDSLYKIQEIRYYWNDYEVNPISSARLIQMNHTFTINLKEENIALGRKLSRLTVNNNDIDIDFEEYNHKVTEKAEIVAYYKGVSEEMSNFIFTSTLTECTITGVRDNSITELTLPDFITEISGAFNNCNNLTKVNYLGTLEGWCNIMRNVSFSQPYDLYIDNEILPNELDIPRTVVYINAGTFYMCKNIKSINIYTRVHSIGERAFDSRYIESITIDQANPYIRSINNCVIDTAGCLWFGCKNSIIPSDGNVKYIMNNAFRGCEGLKNIIIPNSVIGINNSAFEGCSDLTNVSLGTGITYISFYAFYKCNNITSISIPNSVKYIGYYAFGQCDNLKSVEFVNPQGWQYTAGWEKVSFAKTELENPILAAEYLTDTYTEYEWERT